MNPTDMKKILNSVHVELKDGLYHVAIDLPENVVVNDQNSADAMLLSEYIAGAAHECHQLNVDIILNKAMKNGRGKE